MAGLWNLGPVFDSERRINARRWQTYAGRSFFVAALLAGMVTIWWMYFDESWSRGIKNQSKIGEAYFYALVGIQMALTMIAAPATMAGSICVERSRGSLAHVLVTDLTSREIILGKLGARLLPIALLIGAAWPVASIGTLMGGIDPNALAMALAITLAVGLVGCSLSLMLSTWVRSVHEVLMVVYLFWAFVLLAYPLTYLLSLSVGKSISGTWMLTINPFWMAFAPYRVPGRYDLWNYGGFFAEAIALSAACIGLAILGVRVNPIGEARPKRRGRVAAACRRVGAWKRWIPGPSIDGNPVFWREWHRVHSASWLRLLGVILGIVSTAACFQGAFEIYVTGFQMRVGMGGVLASLIQILFGLMMVSVFAALSLSEERRRATLDVLLASPLSTRTIVWGKWLGAFRMVPLLAIGPTAIGVALAQVDLGPFVASQPANFRFYYDQLDAGQRLLGTILMPLTILAHGALITSFGLALASWIPRQARAISIGVVAYIAYAIVLPFLVLLLGQGGAFGRNVWFLVSSPVLTGLELVECLSTRPKESAAVLEWIKFWDFFALLAAMILLESTVRSFDRCFDRIPENPVLTPPGRRRRQTPPNMEIVEGTIVLVTGSGSRIP